MEKHVLSVQDLSCLGRCSLTVALPVLSVMGCRCSVLPTALLSTHTGFPDPLRRTLTSELLPIADHWQRIGARFDAISVGYLAEAEQVTPILQLLERFPALTVIDPVMGDHGQLYGGIAPAQIEERKRLCGKADVLVPNVTEAAMLTGLEYREQTGLSYLRRLMQGLQALGCQRAVITGTGETPDTTGFYAWDGTGELFYQARLLPAQTHGTGDLFAAVLTGSLVKGRDLFSSAKLAAAFVERILSQGTSSTPHGPHFEPHLSWLSQQG